MTTALIGADWASDPGSGSGAGRWTAGLAVGHSRGTGGYRSEAGAGGIDATLTGVYPYAGLTLTDRLSVWTMGRRGNPYDNAMMESFMKTLKVEGVYPMAFESEKDVARHPAALHRQLPREAPTLGPWLHEPQPFRGETIPQAGQIGRLKLSTLRGPLQSGVICGRLR